MKSSRLLFLCTLLSLSVGITFGSQFQILTPNHVSRPGSIELDDPQPDTIAYDNGFSSVYWNGPNYFARVQFTAPTFFQLRSVYFYTNNQPMSADPCSVWVHADDNGNLGDVLSVYVQQNMASGGWNDGNLPQPVSFNPGDIFNIVLGPVPGGDETENYSVMIDSNPTGHSSLGTEGHYGAYSPNVPGDYMIRAGGESGGPYVDIVAQECWNTINGGDPSFNIFPNDVVLLHAEVGNLGTADVTEFSVGWTIRGPDQTIVYTEQSTVTSPVTGQIVELNAPSTFTASASGEYLASCIVTHAEDQLQFNNTIRLRFFVGDIPRWFRYDDNEYNSHIGLNPNAAHGVAFTPTSYSATVDSIRVHFNNFGDAVVAVYKIDSETSMPEAEPEWIDTLAVDSMEWTTLVVTQPVEIYDGESFVVAALYSGEDLALGKDDSPPNQAGITHMSGVGWALEGGSWFEDDGGNWCLQAFIDTSSAIPPSPVFDTDVDQLDFGDVYIDSSLTISFWIANRGHVDDLVISGFTYLPPSFSSIYVFDQAQYTIAAGESLQVALTCTPHAELIYNGRVELLNNSLNDPAHRITLLSEGIVYTAAPDYNSDLPAEFALEQNYPNPFNPSTRIDFALPQQSNVRLTLFNTLGQQVAPIVQGTMEAGFHSVSFDASELSAGLYFYKLEAGSFIQTRKMMLLK
ncbi:T9SS type A sorting domain-containing protein [bacterium]|nr:T9SS type A sorting domain-containing protein [bacterium]